MRDTASCTITWDQVANLGVFRPPVDVYTTRIAEAPSVYVSAEEAEALQRCLTLVCAPISGALAKVLRAVRVMVDFREPDRARLAPQEAKP